MGKGDLRTRRGKLFRGTFGKTRPRKKKKNKIQATQTQETSKTE
ncbi:MAG: 30S ribosomal protein THX [Acidobacteria bacterium]|jgi:30S ribosomal protein S31|nr:MAG: 30S ribosomal protein THX [Acidobacteriota bacterium]